MDEANYRRFSGRVRSSSFNHSFTRRQQPEVVTRRRPSFDSHNRQQRIREQQLQEQQKQQQQQQYYASTNNYLNVAKPRYPTGGTSSFDESGSELEDDEISIYQSYMYTPSASTTQLDNQKPFVDSPNSIAEDQSGNKSLSHSFKERLSVSRMSLRKGASPSSSSMGGHKFGNILGSKSSSSSSSTTNNPEQPQQLYDDGSNAIYPPPQKQTGERDQYGFLKSSQWVTADAYAQFEQRYTPIVKRRLQKWRQLLYENNDQWPSRSSKVKRYIRKGIPPELRGQAWLHYSGAKTEMEANGGLYYELVDRAEQMGNANENMEIIDRDLHRTFPENNRFRPESMINNNNTTAEEKMNIPIIKSLRRVLLAFSLYSPSIGYCQSLNYIAGMLLLFMTEEEAFWTFVVLVTKILPPNIYDVTMEGANIDQNVLMILISERLPHLWNRLSGGKSFWDCEEQESVGMPTCSLVTSHWFLTLFINILPVETVLRVWDCLFYDGQKVLFRVALGIFKLNENEILQVQDPLEVFQVIQNMPKRMVDCNKLIDGTYMQYAATTRVTDEEIVDRRELFKKRRDERRRNIPVQKGHKLLKRSTMRGAIIHKAKEARYYVERAKTVRK
ncbi:GTPase-activating protein gyp3 [Choanephora cucurbitarum]|uniref:GTPase-activating protein gyp3 n=1 Tax=Choanephora cucurbitarum TaxID=101091 RepID=A0A1C7MZU3_9FUNG|nr:GTPase-activating protein gyp3 [Choanephora cucurbitarum]